ncbi:MAG: uracil-DNA glycosylase, partial [Succinatimonas sp.]|nr:uracil-DNA glycosylase [Succinatimonas sp.]
MADWSQIIGNLKHTEAFVHANNYQLQRRNSGAVVFPPKDDVFNAFKYTPLDKLKVVILGQDPYPGVGQAMGLAFSVHTKIPVPRSL